VNQGQVDPLAWLCLLFIRGFLLWLVVPVATIIWVVGAYWFIRDGAYLGRFLGWADNNLVVMVQRSILRAFFEQPTHPWVPYVNIADVTHRIGFLDPV
jgi:hypothetical protein